MAKRAGLKMCLPPIRKTNLEPMAIAAAAACNHHAGLLFARAAWLGDPLVIPLHQLQNGSLLIFAFFMISDPRTAPDSRFGRLIFALSVALAAHYLAFFMQMRPALYVPLIALSPLVLLIDRLFPAERFTWSRPAMQGALQ
jgi:Na+-translocating ferredoxin:NAD+ oxidoreductase RnfD subunit